MCSQFEDDLGGAEADRSFLDRDAGDQMVEYFVVLRGELFSRLHEGLPDLIVASGVEWIWGCRGLSGWKCS